MSTAQIVDSRQAVQCDGCGRAPVHYAHLELGIKICWGCAYDAFNALEDVRTPGAMYLYAGPRREGQ